MSGLLTRNRLIGLAIAGFLFAVDQLVKWYVDGPLGLVREGDTIELLPFFDLSRVHNFGISLGMLQAHTMEARWLLVGFTALIAVVVLVWMMRERKLADILGLSMILGGALGNIVDRATLGYVLDYADFHIGEFRPFLVFNIADAAITIGVVIILVRALFFSDNEDTKDTDSEAVPAEN